MTAKKAAQPTVEQPPQTPAPTTKPEEKKPEAQKTEAVSKQSLAIMRLTVALREKRNVEVKPEMLKQDGKFINIELGAGWPTIQIGASGGIVLPAIRSYAKAFDAALEADKLLAKQQERDAKKVAAAAKPTVAEAKATTTEAPEAAQATA